MEIKLDKVYKSEKANKEDSIKDFDVNHPKRPSWVKIVLDGKIIFVKITFNGEAFWYRRYFKDYFFPLENDSTDYKNYYNEISKEYETFVPQNKELAKKVKEFLKELNIEKDSLILDLGSGTGLVTNEIAKDYSVDLLDISEKEIEIAKSKENLKDSEFFVLDLTKEEIPNKYDVIYETMSLDYFKGEKMRLILNKIKNSLKKKGKFIVIDRHIYPEFDDYFKVIKKGKFELETPEGKFDYFYYVGKK